ncbi:MAG: HD domain-containing protein [Nanoarchaeota archaeon]|nr:HD domain-containing protein [Nanoarchaeota archaeon]
MRLEKLHSFISRLKSLDRTGWTRHNIPDHETVASHSYSVALLSMVCSDELGLDCEKCMRLALVHDLAESVVGDMTPHEISSDEKHRLEKKAIFEIAKEVGSPKLMQLWEEYESGKSEEAKLVKELDKLDMVLQAKEYQAGGKDLSEFFAAKKKIRGSLLDLAGVDTK